MVEEPISPQQHSKPNNQRGTRWPRAVGIKLPVVALEIEERVMIVEVANQVPEDRGLEVQDSTEVESGSKEVY